MNNPVKPLIMGLVFLASAFYLYSIIQAGLVSLNGKSEIDDLLNSAITFIGGVLATNLGAVLGITLSPPSGAAARGNLPAKYMGLRSTVRGPETPPVNSGGTINTTTNQKLQIAASYFYIISLIIALIFFLVSKNTNPNPVPVLYELSKTLLGVAVGAVTVGLGRT